MYKNGEIAVVEPDRFGGVNEILESCRHMPPKDRSQLWDLAKWEPPTYQLEDKPEWAKYRSKVLQMIIALNTPFLGRLPLGFTKRTTEVFEEVQRMREKHRLMLGVPKHLNALSDKVLRSLDDWAFNQQKTSLQWAWIDAKAASESEPETDLEIPTRILEISNLLATVEKARQIEKLRRKTDSNRMTDQEILRAAKAGRRALNEVQKRRMKIDPKMPLADIEIPERVRKTKDARFDGAHKACTDKENAKRSKG